MVRKGSRVQVPIVAPGENIKASSPLRENLSGFFNFCHDSSIRDRNGETR